MTGRKPTADISNVIKMMNCLRKKDGFIRKPNGCMTQHSRLVFGRSAVRILAGMLVVLDEVFCGFHQSLLANFRLVPQLGWIMFFHVLSKSSLVLQTNVVLSR